MSQVIIGVIGMLLFIGLAIAGASYLGPQFGDQKVEAEATRYLSERSQIERAVQSYASDLGGLPIVPGQDPVDVLVQGKYLTKSPAGGGGLWAYDAASKSLVMTLPGSASQKLKVCVAARKRAGIPNPGTPYKCDGSDAPGGVVEMRDPCCVM